MEVDFAMTKPLRLHSVLYNRQRVHTQVSKLVYSKIYWWMDQVWDPVEWELCYTVEQSARRQLLRR